MATIIKSVPVSGKEQALTVVQALAEKYQLHPTDPENILDVSNKKYNVYYDDDEKSVNMCILQDATEESIKEFLVSFPTLF